MATSGCLVGDTRGKPFYPLGMAAKHHRHVALTEPLSKFVERQVAQGRYASASEVVRAGLRLLIEHEEARVRSTKEDGTAHE